jgi:hypothetical protein
MLARCSRGQRARRQQRGGRRELSIGLHEPSGR